MSYHDDLHQLRLRLQQQPCVLVTVAAVQGSAPRAMGTWMAVFADASLGTIGGGHLEFVAISEARALLARQGNPYSQRFPLGPSLGQCCGGVVELAFEVFASNQSANFLARDPALQAATWQLPHVTLFGGGHVGHALVHVLGTLPLRVTWVDSRDEIFPEATPANVQCEHSDPVQAAVHDVPAGSHLLLMSFSHAEDLDILTEALLRQRAQGDLPFIGLIGSKTKWATFRHRLEARGFTEAELMHVTCPIGLPGIAGKEPQVIAVSVAAQLLLEVSQAGLARVSS